MPSLEEVLPEEGFDLQKAEEAPAYSGLLQRGPPGVPSGDHGLVVGSLALETQKMVVTAMLSVGVASADPGPSLVNRARALLLVQEDAHRFEYLVFVVAKHAGAVFDDFGEALLRCRLAQRKLPGESPHIRFGDLHVIIAAAIGCALGTIKIYLLGLVLTQCEVPF
jgi:hypothetical protein